MNQTRVHAQANTGAVPARTTANPRSWPDDVMRADILMMADQLSAGTIAAFPSRFR